MQIRLKRIEAGLHQKTLGVILSGATQRLVHLWKVGRYLAGPRHLPKLKHFLGLDPLVLRVYVLASGLQQRRRHGNKTKPPFGVLKMNQNGVCTSR